MFELSGEIIIEEEKMDGEIDTPSISFQGESQPVATLKGDKGDRGEVGPVGPAGPAGERGERGEIGPVGPVGPRGQKGEQGIQGERGLPGPQGPIGLTGERGERGEIGPAGPTGPAGKQGIQGERGPAGQKGDRGEQGVQGPIGKTGPTGPAGQKGEKGDTGERGPKGDSYTITEADYDAIAEKVQVPTSGYLVRVTYAVTSGAEIQAILDSGNTPYLVYGGNTFYYQDISYDNYYRFVSITPGSSNKPDPPIVKRIYKSVGSAGNQGWGKGTVQLYSTIHKPTASDVGALPSTTMIPSKTSDLTNDSNFATTDEIPTKVSQLENDSHYISSDALATNFIEDYWNINGKASGSQSVANTTFFNFKVRPIDKLKPFRIKFRGFANMPRWTVANLNAQGLAPSSYGNGGENYAYGSHKVDVDVTFFAKDNASYTTNMTDVWQFNTSYRSLYYWSLAYPLTQSQENDWYYFGWSIYSAYQYYTTSSDATFNKLKAVFGRDITTDILEVDNCTFEVLDTPLNYGALPTTTHTKTYYQTTTAGRTQTGDINQVDRTFTAMYKNTDGPLTGYAICMFTSNGGIGQVFTNTANSTGATKTFSDRKFDLSRGIWYYPSSTVRADKYALAGTSFYAVYPTVDLRYTTNCSTYQFTNVVGKDIYMVGTIGDDGYFTPSQEEYVYNKVTYKNYVVDEDHLPTTDDGKVYVLLGHIYSTNKYSMEFVQRHPVYKHNGTRLECIMIV